MNDPLRIFTKEELKILNPFHLNRLKKEMFIPIRFGGVSSVVLNGHTVGKETLEAIFEELEMNFDKYVFNTGSDVLNTFFETGDISFLYDQEKVNEIKGLIKDLPKLEFKIALKLSDVIVGQCINPNQRNFNTLLEIQDFTSEFEDGNRNIAYQKCYEDIESFMASMEAMNEDPFVGEVGVRYKSELGMLVDPLRSRLFAHLPKRFETLDIKYSTLCLSIYLRSVARKMNVNKASKRDLRIFIQAAEIGSKHRESESLDYNIKIAKKALKGSSKSSNGLLSGIGILVGIFSLIRIIIFIANMNSSSSSYDRRVNNNRSQQEIFERILRESQKRERNRKKVIDVEEKENGQNGIENDKTTSQKSVKKDSPEIIDYKKRNSKQTLAKHYAGENWRLINAKYRNATNKNDTVRMTYRSDLMPTIGFDLKYFLNEKFMNQKGDSAKAAIITFENRSLKFSTSHLVNLKIDKAPIPYFDEYRRKLSGYNTKLNLSAKRIPFGDYNVKGHIVTRKTKTGKQIEKIPFSIRYDRTSKTFKVKYKNGNKIEITKSEVSNPIHNCKKDLIHKKFATIINNMGLLHNKYLGERNWYAINSMCEYRIQNKPGSNVYSSGFISGNGNLRYNFTSAVDNNAYVELNTKRTSIKYILNHKSGVVNYMVRATVSEDRNNVEQVIATRQ